MAGRAAIISWIIGGVMVLFIAFGLMHLSHGKRIMEWPNGVLFALGQMVLSGSPFCRPWARAGVRRRGSRPA